MQCLFQRTWHTSVRLANNELRVESTYLGTDKELAAWMIVDPESFLIRRAGWEVYRAQGQDYPQTTEITELEGTEAYFGSGEALNRALSPLGFPEAKELFADGVRGVVQAETFLWQNRGYASAREYEDRWFELFKNGCRYYSNTDRVTGSWYEHVGYSKRSGSLFNRMKSQALYIDHNAFLLSGHFIDSFHSLAMNLSLEKEEGRITAAEGQILRAPDKVCVESSAYMDKLPGKSLPEFNKKEIALLLGAENGCVHLVNLVSDGAQTFSLYRKEKT